MKYHFSAKKGKTGVDKDAFSENHLLPERHREFFHKVEELDVCYAGRFVMYTSGSKLEFQRRAFLLM